MSLRGAGARAPHSDPPTSPAQNGYSRLGSRNPPKLRRAWRETLSLLGPGGEPKEFGRLSLGPGDGVGWGWRWTRRDRDRSIYSCCVSS